MNWVYQILIGLGFILFGIGLYWTVEVQSMSDEERAKWGHGPRYKSGD